MQTPLEHCIFEKDVNWQLMCRVVYEKQIIKDITNLKAAKLDKRAKRLIEIVKNNPFQNPPLFEALVGNLTGLYSRRINIRHRIERL